MESPCPTCSAPKNRRVVRTGCKHSDDVIFRCRAHGAGRFHAVAKWQLRVESAGWERWQIWIGTKSRNVQLNTQRFDLDHKSRKLPSSKHPPASAVTMGGARRPCPRGARSTVQWIGTTLGRLQRCRPTSRARRRTRGAGVCPPRPSPPAAAGPTRHGQARLHVLPCLHKARRRHGAHRRHGALGARRPSSAALRVNDPRTVSKVVCPRPPRTPRCCSAVPVAVEVSTACVYRWQEQQPGKTWEGQCLSTGRRTLGFSAH